MILTKSEFEKKLKNNELRIAFIGMSNIGKSYRTKELAKKKNFDTYTVDSYIGEALGGMSERDMAEWFGFPYEKRFQPNQKTYLETEEKLTKEALLPKNQNFALDTTGSVIYLSENAHDFLKENFLIIHLETPENSKKEMLENFFKKPKPLVWGESFYQKENENTDDALRRCYPELLEYRTKKYYDLADISVEIFQPEQPKPYEYFWELLLSNLPN